MASHPEGNHLQRMGVPPSTTVTFTVERRQLEAKIGSMADLAALQCHGAVIEVATDTSELILRYTAITVGSVAIGGGLAVYAVTAAPVFVATYMGTALVSAVTDTLALVSASTAGAAVANIGANTAVSMGAAISADTALVLGTTELTAGVEGGGYVVGLGVSEMVDFVFGDPPQDSAEDACTLQPFVFNMREFDPDYDGTRSYTQRLVLATSADGLQDIVELVISPRTKMDMQTNPNVLRLGLTQPTPNKGWKGIVEFGGEIGSLKDAGQLIAEIAEDDTSSIAWAQSGYDLLRPSRVQLSRYALAKARGSLICTP